MRSTDALKVAHRARTALSAQLGRVRTVGPTATVRHNPQEYSASAIPRPMPGHPLILWTIRIALACFAVYFGGVIARQPWASDRCGRRLWTLGCVIFIVHVYFAFKYFHQWSYASAVEHTAKETEAIVGLRFGQGILVSYLFLFVWLGDVVWWWVAADQRNGRPWWAGALINGFLFFIAFNGAIIFESGVTRPAGIAVCAVYAILAIRSALRPLPAAEPEKVAAS